MKSQTHQEVEEKFARWIMGKRGVVWDVKRIKVHFSIDDVYMCGNTLAEPKDLIYGYIDNAAGEERLDSLIKSYGKYLCVKCKKNRMKFKSMLKGY